MLNDFIIAHRAAFGSTQKEAREAYKRTDEEYHKALIEGQKNKSKKAFYND